MRHLPRALCALCALCATAAIFATACASIPETHYYVLAPPSQAAMAPAAEGFSIGVEAFAVDSPYDQDQLVYRLGLDAIEVGFYAYHRWAASLGQLAAVAFAEGLRGVPGIALCEPATAAHEYTAVLTGRVVYLEEVDLADSQLARVKLELTLTAADGEVLWNRTLESATSLRAGSAEEVVEQLRRDFQGLVAEAADEVAAVVGRRE